MIHTHSIPQPDVLCQVPAADAMSTLWLSAKKDSMENSGLISSCQSPTFLDDAMDSWLDTPSRTSRDALDLPSPTSTPQPSRHHFRPTELLNNHTHPHPHATTNHHHIINHNTHNNTRSNTIRHSHNLHQQQQQQQDTIAPAPIFHNHLDSQHEVALAPPIFHTKPPSRPQNQNAPRNDFDVHQWPRQQPHNQFPTLQGNDTESLESLTHKAMFMSTQTHPLSDMKLPRHWSEPIPHEFNHSHATHQPHGRSSLARRSSDKSPPKNAQSFAHNPLFACTFPGCDEKMPIRLLPGHIANHKRDL